MRKDDGVDGDAQRISQMVWLLFLKILDDREREWELRKDYKSPIPKRFRWRTWAADEDYGETGENLIRFVNNELFPGLKAMATSTVSDKRERLVGSFFQDAYNYMKNGTLLRQVINKIQEDIDYNTKSQRHLLGEIYEKILRDLQSAGNAGEYYTPRAVTEFMVQMVDPQLHEIVLDPACGTGGFLTCTIEHKRDQVHSPADERTLQASLRGVEKKPLPHMLATTNMLLHGIEDPSFIRRDNMLAKPLRDYGRKDEVNCILTNPPFGGMEEDGIESNFPKLYQTRETADLFLALIVKLLKPGGRAGIVLPDSSLSGVEGVKLRIKEHLLLECNLHTIVRLPNGVFNPYTGIKTNLLFFTKGEPTRSVWFYEHPYPPGVKNYNKTASIDIAEFEAEKAWWCKDTPAGRSHRKDTPFAWQVSLDDIKNNNYNLDIKNPNAEEAKHGDPDELLATYRALRDSIARTQDALRDELVKVLASDSDSTASTAMRRLTDNFGTLMDTPASVTELRKTISQFAVRGKLAPQDSSDEPAIELLQRIKAKRDKVPKAGRIKKPKSLPPIPDNAIPYEVPANWTWARFLDVANIASNLVDPAGFLELPHIAPDSIEKNTGRLLGYRTVGEDGVRSGNHLFEPEQIIYSKIRPNLNKLTVVHFRGLCSADMYPIDSYIDTSFLARYMLSSEFLRQSTRDDTRVAMPKINQDQLGRILVPVPPLPEQKRIVAKVDELMKLCDDLEAKLTKARDDADTLLSSVVYHLRNPEALPRHGVAT